MLRALAFGLRTRWALPLTLAAGALIAFLLASNTQRIQHSGTVLTAKRVDVIEIRELPFRAQVDAYGNVEPTISLLGKAEVNGKISFIHPDLQQGQSIAADTTVLRIDAADYQSLLKQTEADLRASRETLKQLLEEEKTMIRSLALAQENLAVGESELARITRVFEQQLVSRSTLDAERQQVISLRQQVAELQGQLNGFSSRKDSVKANIARAEQQVESQRTTLGRTEITLPFNARIGDVMVEKGEFVSTGATLFEALDTSGVEISAQLPASQIVALISHMQNVSLQDLRTGNTQRLLEQLNLYAQINLVGHLAEAQWQANVLRFGEAVDPISRTFSIVVGVDNPYQKIIPGRRPPLLKGMYTEVRLSAPTRTALVIPRKALHQGRAYIVSGANTLAIRQVEVQFEQNDLAVIRSGISPGEKLIVNDIYPVIEGMPLDPHIAEDATLALAKSARGER